MVHNNQIKTINEYLKKQLWMDFEMCNMDGGLLELYGFLDVAGDNKIKIVFKLPYTVLCNFFFTYEGEGDFISVVEGEEAWQINRSYGVTKGNVIFKISNTYIESDMFIIAKEIEVQIME